MQLKNLQVAQEICSVESAQRNQSHDCLEDVLWNQTEAFGLTNLLEGQSKL